MDRSVLTDAQARARAKAIDDERSAALRAAYREEIGTVVRSASPFLISLLALKGTTIDDAVTRAEPVGEYRLSADPGFASLFSGEHGVRLAEGNSFAWPWSPDLLHAVGR